MSGEELKYPIGKYVPQPYSETQKQEWLLDIQLLPSLIERAIENLDEKQLNTPYREQGWMLKQVVHHVADSHMNALIRFKLGLTETRPSIKPYEQDAWVTLPDTLNLPVNISVTLLHSLHRKWYEILINMKESDWERVVFHPEHKKEMTLWYLFGMYAWHGRHHVAHITSHRKRMNW